MLNDVWNIDAGNWNDGFLNNIFPSMFMDGHSLNTDRDNLLALFKKEEVTK